MSLSLIVTIAVIVFLLIFIGIGCWKGFLRIILTTFSLIVTLVLAGALAKPLAGFVETGTGIGPGIQNRIQEFVSGSMSGLSGTVDEAENAFIQSLPLTEAMKKDLTDRNTVSGYLDQGVSSFSEYIAVNLTHLVVRILCFILLFIVIYLVLRLIIRLSNLINHVPLLGGVNRLFGGIVGLAEGILFLWILCMIIMMMSGTEFGASCVKVIRDSVFLNFIYEHNYLMDIVNKIIGLF